MPKRTKYPWVTMFVRQRGDGETWYARWLDPDTKTRRDTNLTALGKTRPKARELWCVAKSAEIQKRMAALALDPATRVHRPKSALADVVEEWLDGLDVAPTTAQMYEDSVRWVLPLFHAHYIEDVDEQEAARVRDQVVRRRDQPTTANRDLRHLKVFLRWARSRGYCPIPRDLVGDALKPAKGETYLREFLSLSQIESMLAILEAHDDDDLSRVHYWPAMYTMLLTGLRAGEMLGLRWDQIRLDADPPEIRVHPSSSKSRAERAVHLDVSPSLIAMFEGLPRESVYVWGRMLTHNTMSGWSALVRRKGGPRCNPQILRSTCATYLTALRGAYYSSRRTGHGILVAERHYVGLVRVDSRCLTLEQAMGLDPVDESPGAGTVGA